MTEPARTIFCIFFCFLASIIGFSSPLRVAAEDSVQAPEQAEDGFRRMFNGKNLDGWYTL
jgi:phage portal protein BeeE